MLTESAMKHLLLFILCLFGVLSFSITPVIAGDHRSADQPNIVFILADDLGYGDVQCLNPERGKIPTPHMDQLAADGSLSDAQRPSVLLSHYQSKAGSRYALHPDEITLAEMLRPAGYRTFMLGKWHLGFERDGCHPMDCGFDQYFGLSLIHI